jgi:hypothetical protein
LTGDNDGVYGTNFSPNSYIGAMIVVSSGGWTDTITLNDNSETLWYGGNCGASDIHPYPKYAGDDGCMSVDEQVNNMNIGFSVCDVIGADQSYKK